MIVEQKLKVTIKEIYGNKLIVIGKIRFMVSNRHYHCISGYFTSHWIYQFTNKWTQTEMSSRII